MRTRRPDDWQAQKQAEIDGGGGDGSLKDYYLEMESYISDVSDSPAY